MSAGPDNSPTALFAQRGSRGVSPRGGGGRGRGVGQGEGHGRLRDRSAGWRLAAPLACDERSRVAGRSVLGWTCGVGIVPGPRQIYPAACASGANKGCRAVLARTGRGPVAGGSRGGSDRPAGAEWVGSGCTKDARGAVRRWRRRGGPRGRDRGAPKVGSPPRRRRLDSWRRPR